MENSSRSKWRSRATRPASAMASSFTTLKRQRRRNHDLMKDEPPTASWSRRSFLKVAAASAAAGASLKRVVLAADEATKRAGNRQKLPWYRCTVRWGQTNITERDPIQYDIGWWRQHWQRTQIQGVII